MRSYRERDLSMIVIGIDPGISNTGYGVIQLRGGAILALDGGVIVTHKDTPLSISAKTRRARFWLAKLAVRLFAKLAGVRCQLLRTRRNRSNLLFADPAAQTRFKCSGWSPRCWTSRGQFRQTTRQMHSRPEFATPTAARLPPQYRP
jgi:hypothetical protein